MLRGRSHWDRSRIQQDPTQNFFFQLAVIYLFWSFNVYLSDLGPWGFRGHVTSAHGSPAVCLRWCTSRLRWPRPRSTPAAASLHGSSAWPPGTHPPRVLPSQHSTLAMSLQHRPRTSGPSRRSATSSLGHGPVPLSHHRPLKTTSTR